MSRLSRFVKAMSSACTKSYSIQEPTAFTSCHDAKSRRGFAEGAVRAAEWLVGKSGFYDFRNIWREL